MKKMVLILALTTALAGCQFRDDLTDIHASLSDLQQKVEMMNSTIVSLQTLVEGAVGRYSISSVTAITEGNLTIGHTVTFSNGETITIIDGKYGNDAEAPDLSIGQYDDGRWVNSFSPGSSLPTTARKFLPS